MLLKTFFWTSLVVGLSVSSFGLGLCLSTIAYAASFILGFLLVACKTGSDAPEALPCENPLSGELVKAGGLKLVVGSILEPKKPPKLDQRMTGSEIIDNSLREILSFIIRDFITPWYCVISSDSEFPEAAIRSSIQTIAINVSNSVKEVDWIPYLTTRLVDDAASHFRLFKQARARLKLVKNAKSNQNSPSKSQNQHKRNKSETDINKFSNNAKGEKKTCLNEMETTLKLFKSNFDAKSTLEDNFFQLECTMENNLVCRDTICMDQKREKEFLSELTEILLYILIPKADFKCKPICFLMRELFCNCVFLPVINMLSDPDYINQVIIKLCLRESILRSDTFLTVLRLTDNFDELKYTKELVLQEIQQLRSRDTGGEFDFSIKQRLGSLLYVEKLINTKMGKLETCDILEIFPSKDYSKILNSVKPIKLPIETILKNNVALSYFIDHVTNASKQFYICFYLNVEGWKSSAEDLLSDPEAGNSENVLLELRETASNIFKQYLTETSQNRIKISAELVQRLSLAIRNTAEPPNEFWFDEVQLFVLEKLKNEEEFLPSFEKSISYIKLLAELELLNQNIVDDDAISLSSLESILLDENSRSDSSDQSRSPKHVRSHSDVTAEKMAAAVADDAIRLDLNRLKSGQFELCVEIIETGVVSDRGKTFGIYAVKVSKQFETGFHEQWHIYRRYSDFYDFHTRIKEKHSDLGKLPFPGKKTFHNMERALLERRMRMLNIYMKELCRKEVVSMHRGLLDLIMSFVEQGDYDRDKTGGHIAQTINTLVNPLKTGMKTIKNMPEQFMNTMDEMVEGISKVFQSSKSRMAPEASKSDDNIPLRIMLLLMDEVFDLKSRNQWLRRRIVMLLREIIRAVFGDIYNRKIVDYVSLMTSPENVAKYLKSFQNSYWPNGARAEKQPEREQGVKYRTRVAAKIALLSTLSDDLKHIIGFETTRNGLLTVFELFQRPVLNRRLLYVLMEGVVCTLFPHRNLEETFQRLHSNSRRVASAKR